MSSDNILYTGPGKVYRAADSTVVGAITLATSAVGFQPEGLNGEVRLSIEDVTQDIASAMFGALDEIPLDQVAKITFKPMDNWSYLNSLFPPYIGATVGAVTGTTQIGARIFGAALTTANVASEVWTPDGRLYNVKRTQITGHPTLHLGAGKALYDSCEITGIGDTATPVVMGGSGGYLIASNAITESGATDPEVTSTATMTDFYRCPWTGVYGTQSGYSAIQAEDEWTITHEVKYSPIKIQEQLVSFKIDSVRFMAKCRPYGPSQTHILAQLGTHAQGVLLGKTAQGLSGGSDLVLSSAVGSKTITLKNCFMKGAGFEFGGTKLGTGEIGFVTSNKFTSGIAAAAQIVFSA